MQEFQLIFYFAIAVIEVYKLTEHRRLMNIHRAMCSSTQCGGCPFCHSKGQIQIHSKER